LLIRGGLFDTAF